MSAEDHTESYRVWLPVDVRWADMDAMGHVNNAKYFTYCESARMRYFEVVDLYREGAGSELGPAVVTATCNFRAQVRHPAALEVGARASAIGTKSFTLEYLIRHRDGDGDGDDGGDVVADGSSVVVWVDYAAGKAEPLPAALVARIRALDGLDP